MVLMTSSLASNGRLDSRRQNPKNPREAGLMPASFFAWMGWNQKMYTGIPTGTIWYRTLASARC